MANEQDAPGEQENGVAAYGTAALTGPSLTTPQTTPQQSWADNTSEYVGRKRSKKEKKKPIRQLKYDSVKHASTSVFLLRSLRTYHDSTNMLIAGLLVPLLQPGFRNTSMIVRLSARRSPACV